MFTKTFPKKETNSMASMFFFFILAHSGTLSFFVFSWEKIFCVL